MRTVERESDICKDTNVPKGVVVGIVEGLRCINGDGATFRRSPVLCARIRCRPRASVYGQNLRHLIPPCVIDRDICYDSISCQNKRQDVAE